MTSSDPFDRPPAPRSLGVPTEDDLETVREDSQGSSLLDQPGFDTHLARFLNQVGRLDVPTLQDALLYARRQRGAGQTLARALVGRGVLSEPEVAAFVARVREDALARVFESGEDEDTMLRARASGVGEVEAFARGEQIGDYAIVEHLGAGGMGVVYKARHVRTNELVAIKTLSLVNDAEFLTRFRREGQAQARLDHPNLVGVREHGDHAGRPFLVMEFVEGEDLQAWLRSREIEPREAARIVRDIASATAHMHAHGVLHRDLKPTNVLIDRLGRPRLIDFGVARLEGAQTLTRTGDVIGTPAYMSPEQALGDRPLIGPKSDVYSLCAVFYTLLTGRPPFMGASAVTLMTKVVSDPVPPPTSIDAAIPAHLEQICLRGLSKEPEQRYTAQQLAEALDRYLRGESLEDAPPAGSRSRVGPYVFGFALFVAGVSLGLWGQRSGSAPPRAPSATVVPSRAPSPPPSPQAAEVHVHFPSEAFACELEIRTDGAYSQYATDSIKLDLTNRLGMSWQASKLEGGRWRIDAEVREMQLRWSMNFNGQKDGSEFDSRRDAESPFAAVVGRFFSFDLDPRTGRVGSVRGVAAIQSAVFAKIEGTDLQARARSRVPAFQEPRLVSWLEALFGHVPPGRQTRWTRERPRPLVFRDSTVAESAGGGAGLAPNDAPAVPLEFAAASDGSGVRWKGSQRLDTKPYAWTFGREGGGPSTTYDVRQWTERSVEGKASWRDGVPVEVELQETWNAVRVLESGGEEARAPSRTSLLLRFSLQ